MVIPLLPLIVMAIGLLVYLVAPGAKAQELGRIMFFCGLLALCFVARFTSGDDVRIFR